MAGNVWDWTRSVYRPYPYNADDGREDGSEPTGKEFTVRGGNYGNPPIDMCASIRADTLAEKSYDGVGFRLARHLK